MNFKSLTEEDIQRFAPAQIFQRGVGYYRGGRVSSLELDPEDETITAEVDGNYGDYTVEITVDEDGIDADCDCPYDGYPCKHMVAVLLTFVNERGQYLQEVEKAKKQVRSLESKIKQLPQDELVEMVMSCARKYPDFKRELIVRFEGEKPATFNAIKKQIQQAFPSVASNSYSISGIVRTLNSILKSVESASDSLKVDVYWAVADRTLDELNEYGMDEESLEEVAIESMRKLPPLLQDAPELKEKKEKILAELMRYYTWGNCGITDFIYEAAEEICTERSDYEILIDSLKEKAKSDVFSSYYNTLLASLYAQIGDEESQRKTLEERLEYGMDYWRLAEYWLEKGESEKALEIVREGIEKGKGRKNELYLYLQERYEENGDYEGLAELLRSKIQRQELDYHSLAADELYKFLKRHYEAANDYAGRATLLELRLEDGELDFEFYREAESAMREEGWQKFEERFIAEAKSQNNDNLLAEIYEYKGDMESLWDIVKNDRELLKRYEAKLSPLYPQEYLELYQSIIGRYIAARGRSNYAAAAEYAQTVKRIYLNLLKQPEQWDAYIKQLRLANKTLRAMQDEFRHL
ncbi:MAG: SWIM zinc finger family protein, partial [Candidatus Poribacteria bacterium]